MTRQHPLSAIKDERMRDLAEHCLLADWRLVIGKKHIKAIPPDGSIWVSFPKSPSDHRAYFNKRAELRRRGVSV